ncbi:putative deoxynucleoside-5'-monophosphate kinase [Erwinia phage KEY]|uniref:Deoxynucleoside-5'-monophosphate kinase n=1 Tax=Erwinia phage KEY TaxID=2821255 RepID=A0AAE8BE66_9CAUD|nr:putative deoxynucleoside-5'-monophosphate kinase [Erwinia phage KEY]
MTFYIGLCGDAGAGKDTVANMMQEYFEGSATKYSFAEPVYRLAAAILGTTVPDLENRSTKEVTQSWQITQRCLVNARDYFNSINLDHYKDFPEAWHEFVIHLENYMQPYSSLYEKEDTIFTLSISPRKMLELVGTELGREILQQDVWIDRIVRDVALNKVRVAIISDVRFENEAKFIHDKEGELIKIAATKNPYKINSNHLSNKGIDQEYLTGVIVNEMNGLKELEEEVHSTCWCIEPQI